MVAGKLVVVCRLRRCGQGLRPVPCAVSGRGLSLPKSTPSARCKPPWKAFEVTTIEETLGRGDIYVTTTGNRDIITTEHMAGFKDQAIVCNIGHFDNEIQVDKLNALPGCREDHHQTPGGQVRLPRRTRLLPAGRRPPGQPGLRQPVTPALSCPTPSPTRPWPR